MPDQIMMLDNQLCFAIYSASHAFTRAYKPLLKALGLTYPQYLVMLVLWEERQSTVSALGDRLGLDSGTLSPLLKRLEKAGLVRRIRDGGDERIVNVGLTPAGMEAEQQARSVAVGIASAVGCSLEEVVRLKREVNDLTSRLTDAVAGDTGKR